MAVGRPRPYRRILTSALHRRFVHASAIALLVCYIVSFLIGDKSSFLWAWFPIGACGIRTVLLFVSSLVIFVLRVGQMHIGSRTTASPLHTLRHLFPLDIVQTFGWYLFSAWWFSEIYKWSASADTQLEWVKRGKPHERASLNERPIYLYTFHFVLAIVQSVIHLSSDYDRVPIPVAKRAAGSGDQRTHPVQSVSKRIQSEFPRVINNGFQRSTIVAAVCPLVYIFFLRRTAWSFTMYFAKLFWDFPRSAADPPGVFGLFTQGPLVRTVFSGGLLMLCWQTANILFSVFLSKEPLKRGQPLTADAKDPNGSLLTGLTAKKQTVQSFAFWELSFISQQFPDRRKAIFNDIDREGGAAWSQILVSATEVIKGISTRIEESKPPAPPDSTESAEPDEPVLHTMPRLTEPPKEGNFFAPAPKSTSRPGQIGDTVASTAKYFGQSPDWTPKARARARDVFDRASSMLSPERKRQILASSREIRKLTTVPTGKPENVHPLIARILCSPVGRPFRQSYANRLSAIVLGAPHANVCTIVDAIDSLTRLLTASLLEDQYGTVQTDVPAVVRLFTDTIMVLEPFVHGGLEAHWSDATFPPSSNPRAQEEARRVPNVDLVLDYLKTSLGELLTAYDPYLRDIGLVGKDLRLAKEAAGVLKGL